MSDDTQVVGAKDLSELTKADFLKGLQERVSVYSAHLLLESALVDSGMQVSDPLKKEDAKNLCLALIKKGGPAFQVGQALYRRI